MRTSHLALFLLLTLASLAAAPKPVPKSPYLPIIYRYADAVLKDGRDAVGPQKTGLLRRAPDAAVADPELDQNLLRLLYTLSELSSKPIYRDAADAELKWFLENPFPEAIVAPWDAAMAWDVGADKPVATPRNATELSRPWMLWDRCFDLNPDASKRLIVGLGQLHIYRTPSSRRLGYSIRAFSMAYQRTKDDAFLKAIEAALATLDPQNDPASVSAAIDLSGAATRVPEALAARLRSSAAAKDQAFCALPHSLKSKSGFALSAKPDAILTPLWPAGKDGPSTAAVAMLCVSRYENTADTRYRDLIHAAADAYLAADPPDNDKVPPLAYGHAISLQIAAWRSTSRQQHLDRATQLADLAVKRFWPDGPVPRDGVGTDTLALGMVELHLSILHITAVRCPPNTIDR